MKDTVKNSSVRDRSQAASLLTQEQRQAIQLAKESNRRLHESFHPDDEHNSLQDDLEHRRDQMTQLLEGILHQRH